MIKDVIAASKNASKALMVASSKTKNEVLFKIAETLKSHKHAILEANEIDKVNNKNLISEVMFKRLSLTEAKLDDIINGVLELIKLEDPVGEVLDSYVAKSGIVINKVRVPFGLVGIIYESRPNVTVDVACLCLKTGNACLLKGGKEASNTSRCFVQLIKDVIKDYFDPNIINYVDNREDVEEVLTNKMVDLVIPRGSKKLIDFVVNNAKVPVIETGAGVCHAYVDSECDLDMALEIIKNAKLSNPAVCNSLETVLVNKKNKEFIKTLYKELPMVEFRGNQDVLDIIPATLIKESEYNTEYNDLIMSVKIVDDLKEAINHIEKYGTHHSDTIISSNLHHIEEFLNCVDSACVYSNASTRFTDGGCFGFGAEIGIATSKLHARGPMGLKEITTYKYKITGHGEIR